MCWEFSIILYNTKYLIFEHSFHESLTVLFLQYDEDLECYLPGRTFSIISPSVGAESSCLVSLRAKNHIWRARFRRAYKGGSTGHISELHHLPTHMRTQRDAYTFDLKGVKSKCYKDWGHLDQLDKPVFEGSTSISETQTAFCGEPQIKHLSEMSVGNI